MKHCNQCLISKPTVDFYKNRAKADGCSDQCKLCCRKNSAKLRVTNPDKARYAVRRARESNRDAYNARRRGALGAERRSKYAASQQKYFQEYRQKNKAKLAAYRAHRRAVKANATPKWANASAIALIYREARAVSLRTGVVSEVDHIVPLANDLVCGLHCEQNLQILPRGENRKKSNKFWPDMPNTI